MQRGETWIISNGFLGHQLSKLKIITIREGPRYSKTPYRGCSVGTGTKFQYIYRKDIPSVCPTFTPSLKIRNINWNQPVYKDNVFSILHNISAGLGGVSGLITNHSIELTYQLNSEKGTSRGKHYFCVTGGTRKSLKRAWSVCSNHQHLKEPV